MSIVADVEVPSSTSLRDAVSRFYLPQLDGLRFFAFFLVFPHHSPVFPGGSRAAASAKDMGVGRRRPVLRPRLARSWFPASTATDNQVKAWLFVVVPALSLTVALSAFSYFLLERPFLRIKSRFTLVPNRID